MSEIIREYTVKEVEVALTLVFLRDGDFERIRNGFNAARSSKRKISCRRRASSVAQKMTAEKKINFFKQEHDPDYSPIQRCVTPRTHETVPSTRPCDSCGVQKTTMWRSYKVSRRLSSVSCSYFCRASVLYLRMLLSHDIVQISENVTVQMCNACGLRFKKGQYCPVCLKVYYSNAPTPETWKQCRSCGQWTHRV